MYKYNNLILNILIIIHFKYQYITRISSILYYSGTAGVYINDVGHKISFFNVIYIQLALLACVLKYPFIICKPYALFSDFPYKNKPRNAPNYTLIIPAVNMESRRCYFTGEENHPKKKRHRKIGTDQQHGCSRDQDPIGCFSRRNPL